MSTERPLVRLAQFAPALADVPGNLERMLEITAAAEKDGVDLLVFPELALTGYGLKDLTMECAVGPDSPEIRALAEASRKPRTRGLRPFAGQLPTAALVIWRVGCLNFKAQDTA